MKINPVQFYTPIKIKPASPSFKSNIAIDEDYIINYERFDDVTSPLYDNCRGQITLNNSKIYNRNTTNLFRCDIDWIELGKYIENRFQDNKKINIYDYGCSKGLEAYSLSILLQHTQQNPEKFFPIYAKDIDKEIISLNELDKDGRIIDEDHYRAYYNSKGTLQISDDELEQYAKIEGSLSKRLTEFTDKTTNPVRFSYGNILEDIDKIDSKHPSIIFARNMWPYIEANEYDNFAKKLYDKIAYNSVFIIGGYDKSENNYLEEKGTITQALLNAGFIPHKGIGKNIGCVDDCIVFEKNERTKERGEIKRNGKIFNMDSTYFLRLDMQWDKLMEFIKEKYKNEEKINLYDYACSKGYEAYTISMCLQQTQQNPERFFPIIAKDIRKKLIEENNYQKQNGQSNLYEKDTERKLKRFLPEVNLYDNEYFDAIFDIDTTQLIFKNKTTDPVEFSYGNILNDVDKIDNNHPSIIFARNMWPYVDSSEYENFAKSLYERLKPGSMLVIGSIDVIENKLSKALIEAGFKPSHSDFCPEIDCSYDYMIYEKV